MSSSNSNDSIKETKYDLTVENFSKFTLEEQLDFVCKTMNELTEAILGPNYKNQHKR